MTIRLCARALSVALAYVLITPGTSVAQDPPPPEPAGDIDPYRAEAPAMRTAAETRRTMRFPVKGTTSYVDTFGACRDGCTRTHMGADIFGTKLQHLVAANDGWITLVRSDASGTAGNALAVTDEDGWRYLYLHINNDTPGTDDGRNPARWRFAPGIGLGVKVYAGQHIAYLGDSGNAETTPPHVDFELRRPDGVTINPDASLRRPASGPRPACSSWGSCGPAAPTTTSGGGASAARSSPVTSTATGSTSRSRSAATSSPGSRT